MRPRRNPAASLAAALAALLGGLLLVISPASAGEPITPTAELAIRNLVKSYTEAWRLGLRRTILKHLDADAVLMPHHGVSPVEGKDAIDRFWWPDDAPKTGVSRFDIEPDEVYGEGDLAFLRGRFTLEYWVGEDEARQSFSSRGNWMAIIMRNDQGRWLLHRIIWNDPTDTNIESASGGSEEIHAESSGQ
jgi:ketosteroid isomerase-like protein